MCQDVFTFYLQACFKHRTIIQLIGAVVGSSLAVSLRLDRTTVRYASIEAFHNKKILDIEFSFLLW